VLCGFSVQAVGIGSQVVDGLAERGVVTFILGVQQRAAGVTEFVAHQLVLSILVALWFGFVSISASVSFG
jgi:hypothetical protein